MRSEPSPGLGDEMAHHAAYLDYYRRTCVEKCRSLSAEAQRSSRLPSGWTPLGLLHHLAMMERRWFVWGFLGEAVEEPWADSGGEPDSPWRVPEGWGLDDAVVLLEEYAARTREVLERHAPEERASPDGRFAGDEPPDLRWICFHVLQEYARHAGHLDIVVELADGHTGE